MIASTIGRTFLNAYNNKTNRKYTAKEFFEKEYFEYFYNHPKYMQWVTNSPFVQMKSGQKPHLLNEEQRKEKLNNLFSKIENGERDASIAIGYPAAEQKEFATTSGLVSDIDVSQIDEDVYLSWIGGGLGIGVAGGYSIFFDNADILIQLFEGWKTYRTYLNDSTLERMRGNQINTWNGQWLNFSFNKRFNQNFDFTDLENNNVFTVNEKLIEVNTVKWSELFFNISNKFPESTITGYVYSLGQTNKTLGFYPFRFEKARKLIHFYQKLFGENAAITDSKTYESLFGIHIKRACELGALGLQALEPKDIRKYFGKEANLKLVKPKVNPKKGESDEDFNIRKQKANQKDYDNIITYRTYKTWLLAMITKNKEENLNYSEEVAKVLFVYKQEARVEKKFIEERLFKARGRKQFLNELSELIKIISIDYVYVLKDLRDRIYSLNDEDYQYLFTLIKFDYAFQERISNQ